MALSKNRRQEFLMRCQACQNDVPPGFKFCGNCGQSLEAATADPITITTEATTRADFETERRYVTVMFCDLVDSTVLSDYLDPEETLALLNQYHEVCGSLITENGGHIAQYLGDGLLVYFGYPEAHEDDSVRAIQAALDITGAFEQLNSVVKLPKNFSLAVRIGIHTGEVVTASVGHGEQIEQLALGEVPNIAARLQSLAPVNKILVSEETRSLAAIEFKFEPLGDKTLKGVRKPVTVHSPTHSTSAQTRWHAGAVNPMVDREEWQECLLAKFHAAQSEGLQIIKVTGPAGIGKSRLLLAFDQALAAQQHVLLIARCAIDHHTSFLYPFANLIRECSEIFHNQSPQAQIRSLEKHLQKVKTESGEENFLEPFGELLNIPREDKPRWLQGRPEDQKQQIFNSLIRWFAIQSSVHPLVLVVEDIHWADPSTQELLLQITERLKTQSLLLITTQRLEELLTKTSISPVAETLHLGAMSTEHCTDIIRNISDHLNNDNVATILNRADGIPLFVQEFTRLTITGNEKSKNVPSRVRNLFTARLDRLGEAKRIAVIAAVIGREFTSELLRLVTGTEPQELKLHLDSLLREDIITRKQDSGVYVFVQALMREAIVANLLHRTLKLVHRRIADKLETNFPLDVNRHPEKLARHWANGEQLTNALPYFAKAADRAFSVYANAEAISLYREALQLANNEPENEFQDIMAPILLEMHEHLGDVLALVHDYTDAVCEFEIALKKCPSLDSIRRARIQRKIGEAGRDKAPFGIPYFEQALTALGALDNQHQSLWHQEWSQIKFEMFITYYQQGNITRMTDLVQEIAPVVAQHGTAHQRAEFANQLLLVDQRQYQFSATETSLHYSREFVKASEVSEDLPLLAAACSTHAFVLMTANKFEQAGKEFKRALQASKKAGYRTALVRTLIYYAVLERRRGRLDRVIKLSNQAADAARQADMKMYVYSADANLAWVAWRQKEFAQAEALALNALEGWNELGASYPFRWLALMPLAAVTHQKKEALTCARYASLMTDSSQQLLDQKVMTCLTKISTLLDSENIKSVYLEKVNAKLIKAAHKTGYL